MYPIDYHYCHRQDVQNRNIPIHTETLALTSNIQTPETLMR